ncbi:MAG TPA: hypothetical protein VN628_10590 [Vicinamibacterales bacterium]|nr:hypothetical protein [Vicinamibacterales bacterium]
MKRTLREVAAAAVLSLVIFIPAVITLRAQSVQGPDLIGALKKTPGVLGVEAGQMMSGKQVIFAWFENKDAVLKWYYSDAHQALMAQFGSSRRPQGPMADVPNDGRPILAIASVTVTGPPPTSAADLKSVPQIAIELYAPLPGGLAVGGRFAPSTVKVPGMVEVPAQARAAQ